MEAVATRLAQLEQECGVDTSVEEYLKEFHWGLTEVVYEWARQMVGLLSSLVVLYKPTCAIRMYFFCIIAVKFIAQCRCSAVRWLVK